MAITTEKNYTGEFLVSQFCDISFDQVVLSVDNLKAGEVLGKITATGKYVQMDPGAVDGSEVAAAICYADVDASAADANGVVLSRLGEVDANLLVWITGITAGEITAATAELAAKNIIVR